jgi:regulation of enolase protein 1 (concanavalin A-like superfamily)
MNSTKKGSQGRRLIAILVQTVEIGIILLLGVAVFWLWQNLQQSTAQTAMLQATVDTLKLENEQLQVLIQPTATPPEPLATATASAEDANVVSFSDPNNPASLNPMLSWQPGNAPANAYDLTLAPGALTLTAGPGTDQWQWTNTGPFVVLPVSGDFDVTVKVKASPFEAFQRAGIGVRSTQDINSWVNISRNFHSGIAGSQGIMVLADQAGSSSLLNNVPYTGEECFLRIERHGSELNLSYSEDGTNWTVLQGNYVPAFADPVEVFLMASSSSAQGLIAQFSELTLTPKP